ncbi:MAG: hypothetical protein ACXVPL_01315 [Actinomycetota bacterium]
MASTLAPGPSGKLLQQAASHGASSGATAAVFGLAAALVATTLAMAQVERSANRLAASQIGAARSGTSRPSGWRSRPGCCSRSAG